MKGWAANVEIDNFANNLHHTANSKKINDSSKLGSCLYTNTDDAWKHLTIKLSLAISNHKTKSNNQDGNTTLLIYKNASSIVILNSWNNPEYFTVSFSFLIFFDIRGYISAINFSKKGKILLKL